MPSIVSSTKKLNLKLTSYVPMSRTTDRSLYSMKGVNMKDVIPRPGPRLSTAFAVIIVIPLGGTLLVLSGLTLFIASIALAIAVPLVIIFSPVILPAAITLGLIAAGFLASGALGVMGLSSIVWIINYLFRGSRGQQPAVGGGYEGIGDVVMEPVDYLKWRTEEAAGSVGQKVKDAGEKAQGKAQEATGKSTT